MNGMFSVMPPKNCGKTAAMRRDTGLQKKWKNRFRSERDAYDEPGIPSDAAWRGILVALNCDWGRAWFCEIDGFLLYRLIAATDGLLRIF